MPKVAKTFKLDSEAWEILIEQAESNGKTMTAMLSDLIYASAVQYTSNKESNTEGNIGQYGRQYSEGTEEYPSNTEKALERALEALTDQLKAKDSQIAEKDRQIESLGNALASAQESTKAAQALHATAVVPELQEGRESLWERFKALWKA